MGDGSTHGNQRLPWLSGANDENEPHSELAAKMLWALFALLLLTSVALVSYLAGRASVREPLRLVGATVPAARQAPAAMPPLTSPPPELQAAPPVARMLEAEARTETATLVGEQRVKQQSVIPKTRKPQSRRAPEFRPSRRVRVARRAIARRLRVQPQRIVYASRIAQLGVYLDRRQATAAHSRLVRVYPYLKTLPKTIKSLGAQTMSGRAYHLRVQAYSPEHARVLCQNLLSIGRGCRVLPEPA